MCGIAGVFGFDAEDREGIIGNMTNAMLHRGPDAGSYWNQGDLALGHRRLSIIDLSEAGNQPIHDSSGKYTMIFNGEVYNFEEVRKLIGEGYSFRTKTDTEVVLAAYIKWGEKCLEYFNGMFALAIWDANKEELFIARDRLGIKPLYYYESEGELIFASELRALIASGKVKKEVSESGIFDFLSYQTVHAPNTIIKGVFQLMPGQSAKISKKEGFSKKTYWNIYEKGLTKNTDSIDKVRERVKEILKSAVSNRLVSDVPLGAFLSGGIDSSAIVALMSEISKDPINTFSIIFDDKEFDESQYSRLIAKKYNTKHTEILLRPKDFLKDLPLALQSMDSPSCDGVNTYTVSRLTKEAGITVALSGLGGDELFVGYPLYYKWLKLNMRTGLWKLPMALRKSVAWIVVKILKDHRAERIAELLKIKDFSLPNVFPTFRKVMTQSDFKRIGFLFKEEEDAVKKQLLKNHKSLKGQPLLTQSSIADITSYTQNILLRDSDQMSMASSLELRVPFFDHRLVEYALSLPDDAKYAVQPKQLLVDSLTSKRLPDEIVYRKKMGFSFPWDHWLKNDLKDFCEHSIHKLSQRSLFDAKGIMSYWNSFLKGDKRITWVKVWSLVILSEWLENNEF